MEDYAQQAAVVYALKAEFLAAVPIENGEKVFNDALISAFESTGCQRGPCSSLMGCCSTAAGPMSLRGRGAVDLQGQAEELLRGGWSM